MDQYGQEHSLAVRWGSRVGVLMQESTLREVLDDLVAGAAIAMRGGGFTSDMLLLAKDGVLQGLAGLELGLALGSIAN